VKTTTTSASVPADIRKVIVLSLAAALAKAWKKQQKDERPAACARRSGRDDVPGAAGQLRKLDESSITSPT
jgi:hypothetical protein